MYMYIYIYIHIHGKWFEFVAAAIYRGIARRVQQIGFAAVHIWRSEFRNICSPFDRMS